MHRLGLCRLADEILKHHLKVLRHTGLLVQRPLQCVFLLIIGNESAISLAAIVWMGGGCVVTLSSLLCAPCVVRFVLYSADCAGEDRLGCLGMD